MSDFRKFATTEESFWDTLKAELANFPDGKREHFLYAIRSLFGCYKSEKDQAIVVIAEGLSDQQRTSLIAINANESEVENLIDTLCVFRQIGSKENNHLVN
ncbi:MAG: hypothetical protein ACOYB1_14685 [Limnohabitans sp.]